MIAALYVQEGGAYYGIPDVDPWPESRDARLYAGPWPVVAHPPCQRWGRYWHGGPSAKVRRVKGDDDGCFASALSSVERWGGVLEHPEASSAWAAFGLDAPPKGGGWVNTREGWTCCVEQGNYGHRARKATWLYLVGARPPSLRWGRAEWVAKLEDGFHSREERARFKAGLRQDAKSGVTPAERTRIRDLYERLTGKKHFERLTKNERSATPPAFRDLLLDMARSVHAP